MRIGVISVTFLYLLTTCAFIYLVPVGSVTSAPEFARRAGEALLGSRGPSIFAAIVVLSVTVSMLALLVMAPRVYVAMSDDGLFPRALGSLNQTTRTPVKATALHGSPRERSRAPRDVPADRHVLHLHGVRIHRAGGSCARSWSRPRAPGSPFRLPGYPYTSALFILLIVVVLVLVAVNRPLQAGSGIVLLLLGLPA